MAKKYRLLPEGNGLYRLEALKEFSISKKGNVIIHKGDLGPPPSFPTTNAPAPLSNTGSVNTNHESELHQPKQPNPNNHQTRTPSR